VETINKDNQNSIEGSENATVDLLWAEEKGNAHAETMRFKERGKRMARFIHYYTRSERKLI
jgi:hypothetical protein